MTVDKSLEGANVTWLADGYKYGMNRPSSASNQFLAEKPPIAFTRPVVKLGSDSVMVLGAQTPTQAALQRPKSSQERRVFQSTYEKLMESLNEPLDGEKYIPVEHKRANRPKSAPSRSMLPKQGSAPTSRSSTPLLRQALPQRPASAQPPSVVRPPTSPRPASARSRMQTGKARVRSAGSLRSMARSPSELRKSYTFITRNYEEEMYRLHTYTSPVPCPDLRYFDRHARCFDHAHVHTQLQRQRPATACDRCHAQCPSGNVAYELDKEDRKRIEEESRAYYKRYVDSMRPKTAPPTLRSTQQNKPPLPQHNNIQRGVAPHFCNFVRKVRLKEKDREKPAPDHSHAHNSHDGEDDLHNATSNSIRIGSSWGKRSSITWSAVKSVSEVNEPPDSVFTPRTGSEGGDGESAQNDWPDVIEVVSTANSLEHLSASSPVPSRPPSVADSNRDKSVTFENGPRSLSPSMPASPNRPASASSSLSRAEIRIPTPRPESPTEQLVDDDHSKNKNNSDSDGADNDRDKSTRNVTVPPPKLTRSTAPPEPHTGPNQHTNEATKKARDPIKKKERKPFERERRVKEEEEEVVEEKMEEEKPPEPEPVKTPEPIPEPPKPKVIEAPELPTLKKEKKEGPKRMQSRSGRHAMPIAVPTEVKRQEPTQAMKDARKAFELNLPEMSKEDLSIQRPKVQPWLQGRLALSQQSCRFELPIDMKVLEKLSAVDYLRTYCVLTTRRETLYQKIHGRYKDRTGKIGVKDLEKALRDVLINTITKDDIKKICEVVGLNEESVVEYKLFAGIAAMAERMLYPKFLTEDTEDKSEYKKEKIECADFSALEWKFHGVNVNPQVRRVLESL